MYDTKKNVPSTIFIDKAVSSRFEIESFSSHSCMSCINGQIKQLYYFRRSFHHDMEKG